METILDGLNFLSAMLSPLQPIFGFLAFVITAFGFCLSVPRIRREVERLKEEQRKASHAAGKIRRIEEAIGNEDAQVWLKPPDDRDPSYLENQADSIPIITVANLKGGVGKTTISANLAAACAQRGERVLVVDMDWQGSLSSLMIGQAGITDQADIDVINPLAEQLLEGNKSPDWLTQVARNVGNNLPTVKFIPSYYRLGSVENNLMFRWLLGETQGDIRYNLANILFSEPVRKQFDRVIIDAPPRFTTGSINALCASTHLLVPTILDRQSTNAVGRFLAQVKRLERQVCPRIELVGVIGSMTAPQLAPTQFEKEVIGELQQRLAQDWGPGDHFICDARVQRRRSVVESAGQNLAYFCDSHDHDTIKQMFDQLADVVIQRTAR